MEPAGVSRQRQVSFWKIANDCARLDLSAITKAAAFSKGDVDVSPSIESVYTGTSQTK